MVMVEDVPWSYDDSVPHFKLTALFSGVLGKVNDMNLCDGEESFDYCITPLWSFMQNILHVIHENIIYLTDILICEHCDGAEAEFNSNA